MNAKGCVAAGCGSLALGMAIVGLVFVSVAVLHPPVPESEPAPEVEPAPVQRATPTPDPERFLSQPGERREFSQQVDGTRYRMRYGFVDYSGRRQEVACAISRDAVARASRSFGWDETEISGDLNAQLQVIVDREIRRRELEPYVTVTFEGDGEWHWRGRIPPDTETSARVDAFEGWLKGDFARISERTEAQIFKRHGLLLRNHVVSIDYNAVAAAGTDDLGGCYDALVLAAGSVASERYFMGLLLAFLQELKYEVPPEMRGQRSVFGLWVPAQVMVEGKGDCDSKATAFAALWRRRRPRTIIIIVPHHALVGVEGKPGPGESFVQVGNRYYVLCEVAGPGKFPPGHKSISGSFEYVTIDPIAG